MLRRDSSDMLGNRFDAGGKRAHYVILPIAMEDDWVFYKDVVKGSQVSVAEIVVDLCNHGISKHGQDQEDDDDPMEHLTQEQVRMQGDMNEVEEGDEDDDFSGQGGDSSGDDDDFDICRDNNNSDNVMFENEEGDNGDISASSEEEECADEGCHF
ncbi:hypothetical protein HU200_002708 [Digitaria exilis]|uniref:Uncharacterized protein n=1 Tax=Digitaria exilis TaxID=1010633 RepID=A0A835FV81_9POAL|nr:hypothetical protein HU200_002708 [Digitaria exilis]